MRLSDKILNQLSRAVPSKKKITYIITMATLVYVFGIPIGCIFNVYFRRDYIFNALNLSLKDNDKIFVDFCIPSLKMFGGLVTQGTVKLDFGNEIIVIEIPEKKWKHLEKFKLQDYLKIKFYSKGERDPKYFYTRPNKLSVTLKIKIRHKFKVNYVYQHTTYVDLNERENSDKESVKINSIEKTENGNHLTLNINATKNAIPFLNVNVENLKFGFLAHETWRLCDFVISANKNDLNIKCTIDKENLYAIKNFLYKIENENSNDSYVYFKSKLEIGDSPIYNFVLLLIEALEFRIAKNTKIQNKKIKEGVKFRITETDENKNSIMGSISVYKDLFPHYIIYQMTQKIIIDELECKAQISNKKLISGKIFTTDDQEENYFVLHFTIKVIDLEDLIINLIKPTENYLIITPDVNTKSIFNLFLSNFSVIYDLRSNITITTTKKLKISKKTESKQSFSGGFPLKVETLIDGDEDNLILQTKINSQNNSEKLFVLKIENEINWVIDDSLTLVVSEGELYFDTSVPLNKAISLSKEMKINFKLTDFNRKNFVVPILSNLNIFSYEESKPKKEFAENFQSIALKLESVVSPLEYKFKFIIQGNQIKNPVLDWSIKSTKEIKFNASLDKNCKKPILSFNSTNKNLDKGPFKLEIRLLNLQMRILMGEDDWAPLPYKLTNIISVRLVPGSYLSIPCDINFKALGDCYSLTNFLVNFMNKYKFASKELIKKITKERNSYDEVTKYSKNNFDVIGTIKTRLRAEENEVSGIMAKLKINFCSDSKHLSIKREEELEKIEQKIDAVFENDYDINFDVKKENIKSNNSSFEIKTIKLEKGKSYFKIYNFSLNPTKSENAKSQNNFHVDLELFYNFNETTKDDFAKKPIKCYYGMDSFEFVCDIMEAYKFLQYIGIFKANSSAEIIRDDEFVLEETNLEDLHYSEIFKNENINEFSKEKRVVMKYVGPKLTFFQKIARFIRRINFPLYPKNMNVDVKFILDNNKNIQNYLFKIEFPLDYKKDKMDPFTLKCFYFEKMEDKLIFLNKKNSNMLFCAFEGKKSRSRIILETIRTKILPLVLNPIKSLFKYCAWDILNSCNILKENITKYINESLILQKNIVVENIRVHLLTKEKINHFPHSSVFTYEEYMKRYCVCYFTIKITEIIYENFYSQIFFIRYYYEGGTFIDVNIRYKDRLLLKKMIIVK